MSRKVHDDHLAADINFSESLWARIYVHKFAGQDAFKVDPAIQKEMALVIQKDQSLTEKRRRCRLDNLKFFKALWNQTFLNMKLRKNALRLNEKVVKQVVKQLKHKGFIARDAVICAGGPYVAICKAKNGSKARSIPKKNTTTRKKKNTKKKTKNKKSSMSRKRANKKKTKNTTRSRSRSRRR